MLVTPRRLLPYYRDRAEVGHGPGRAERVGNGHAHEEPARGKFGGHLLRQARFAAEEMPQARDLQKQAVRVRGILDADDGAEALTARGQL